MTFRASIITLYPEMFPGPLGVSLAGRALDEGKWQLETTHLREFGEGKHHKVDDTPAGGGAGMVLKPDVLAKAIDAASPEGDTRPRLLMSPRGKTLEQKQVRDLAMGEGAVIICGRFEGIDQRVIEARNLQEISIGDYILSGGEPAALVMLDAIVRLLPGVMGNDQSGENESFETGLLEHPHYTRPQVFEGREIPEILTSGNHGKVAKWQREQAEKLTRERRPDLLGAICGQPVVGNDLVKITSLEESLWIAKTRYDDNYMDEVFAPDFIEFGRSGRRYSRDEMFFGKTTNDTINATLPLKNFSARYLYHGCIQVTYISEVTYDGVVECGNRSSIWSLGKSGMWQLRFHQGTAIGARP